MDVRGQPRTTWHRRGHRIVAYRDGQWRWAASGRWLKYGSGPKDPPCALCHRPPSPEGFDACLGEIPGAISACCGHGVAPGHVTYEPGQRIDWPVLEAAPDGCSYRGQVTSDGDQVGSFGDGED
jgi:hypothetical protein